MRYVVPILGLLLVIGALAGIKVDQISNLMKAGAAFEEAGPPAEVVSTDFTRDLAWENTLSAVGTFSAARGVAISTEAPGMVKRILFESGGVARAGQVLVELDTNVERAQLASAEVRKKLAEQNLKRTRSLVESGAATRQQLENEESQLESAVAEIASVQAQISRKIVRAPFAGRLGIRAVNLGQYLSPGTQLTTLESLDTVYMDFTLPQQVLSALTIGLAVRVSLEGTDETLTGTIEAIDPSIDPATRSVRIRASVPNPAQKLRPGMFGNVTVVLPERSKAVVAPATAIVHAPYGDSVFVVEPAKNPRDPKEKQVRQQFVRLGEERGDFVEVLEGVKPGDELVSSGAFKLRNGAKIMINNKNKPEPELSPRLENR
jgi:membrane fusion protein (multidrug efflux system)